MSSNSPVDLGELLPSKAYVPKESPQRIARRRSEEVHFEREEDIDLIDHFTDSMNYPQFTDLSGVQRQAPSPNMNQVNGINGTAATHPGMANQAGPAPAGHQQDLNMINAMLEEYARVMEENRQSTARILEATGRVRQHAMERDLTNDELIDSIAKEMNGRHESHLLMNYLLISRRIHQEPRSRSR